MTALSYQQIVTEDVRLRTLQALEQAAQYTLPEAALQGLLERHGHMLALDRVMQECAWLDEAGLLSRLPVGETAVLTLTGRGLDVARGRAGVPGVARPRPGETS